MSAAVALICWCMAFVAALAIGAYLVMHGHTWIGVGAMVIGGLVSVKTGAAAEKS